MRDSTGALWKLLRTGRPLACVLYEDFAAREALEETGVRVRVDRLAATSVHPEVTYDNGDRAAYLDLTFACTWVSGEAAVGDDESVDVRWWPIAALPAMSETMRERIGAALSGESAARFRA